jgi:ketosteroid isomerase-like protein
LQYAEVNEVQKCSVSNSVIGVQKFDAKDLKIAIYGEVANVTFHSDFQLYFGETLVAIHNQITLLFVKTANGWKIVYELHSPLKMEYVMYYNN